MRRKLKQATEKEILQLDVTEGPSTIFLTTLLTQTAIFALRLEKIKLVETLYMHAVQLFLTKALANILPLRLCRVSSCC